MELTSKSSVAERPEHSYRKTRCAERVGGILVTLVEYMVGTPRRKESGWPYRQERGGSPNGRFKILPQLPISLFCYVKCEQRSSRLRNAFAPNLVVILYFDDSWGWPE